MGEGITWMLKHSEYEQVYQIFETHPLSDRNQLRLIKNPYYLSFQKIIGNMIKMQAAKGTLEKVQVIFDEGIDRKENLETAFKMLLEVVRLDDPRKLSLLVNKEAEFRDDRYNPPLQAADLLAWHLRRAILEISRGRAHTNEAWDILQSPDMKYLHYRYEASDWEQLLMRMQAETN